MALLALTVAAYLPVFWNDFVDYDDPIYVTHSRHVQQGISLSSLKFAWTTLAHGNWHPLTWMSLELDFQLFGLHAAGFHLTNLVLHLATVLSLFHWLQNATRAAGRSFLTAALFATHPLHVESVAWIAERKDVLSAFFLMLTLLAYQRYLAHANWKTYGLVTFAFGCGLLSKSMLVTVPLLLLLVDFWPAHRRRAGTKVFLEKSPWLAMSLGVGVVTVFAQQQAGNLIQAPQANPLARLAGVLAGFHFYLEKTVWPVGLIPFYPTGNSPDWMAAFQGAALLLGITAWVLWFGRQRPWLIFGWGWFVVSLLPVIGLLQVGEQAYADRYAYIPHVGLFTMLVWEAHHWLSRLPASFTITRLATGMMLAVCSLLTIGQIRHWNNSEKLWQHTLMVQESNWLAHYQLAVIRIGSDNLEGAARHLARANELNPENAKILGARGYLALTRQEWSTAESLLNKTVSIDPSHTEAHYHLYEVHAHADQLEAAEAALTRHCEVSPSQHQARCELGLLKAFRGNLEGALREFQHVLEINPQFAFAHVAAAEALLAAGRTADARQHLLKSLKITTSIPQAHILIADQLVRERNSIDAAKYYRAALALNPHDTLTQAKLQALQQP